MRNASRIVRSVGTIAAVALTGFSASAVAAGGQIDTKLTGKVLEQPGDGFAFKGQVQSDVGKCERKRLVTVYRRQEGPDVKVGQDITDFGGQWKVEANLLVINADHVAKVTERELDNGKTCAAAQSKNFQSAG